MEHESNIQKLDFAVLVPQAQRGDSRAVNSLLLGFTPMVRAFKYNSYYVHYLEQDDTEILALMAVNDAIKSFKQHNFHFFATHVKYTIRRQPNIQVQKKKNLFDAELATLDEEGCTSLDALSSECYKESISRDERSACVLELVARLPQMQRLVISEVFLRGKSQREVAAPARACTALKRQRWILCAGLSALGRKDCADGTALCFYAACFGDV